jgi:hypothetical protein
MKALGYLLILTSYRNATRSDKEVYNIDSRRKEGNSLSSRYPTKLVSPDEFLITRAIATAGSNGSKQDEVLREG